jgi:hypothetical protein
MARQAALLVADEIYYNLVGKAILHGIYHSDLLIPTEPSIAPQLLFYFMMETDLSDSFKSLAVEVTLPGNAPVRQPVPITFPIPTAQHEGRARLFYRHPMLIQAPTLRQGRIIVKVIHESGEIIVGAPWIGLLATTPSAATKAN